MVKIDPHKHEMYYKRWKERGSIIKGTTPENRELIIQFVNDMEIGLNVNPTSKKGARSYGRLRVLVNKLTTLSVLMHEDLQIKTLTELENRDFDLLKFFKKIREGELIPKNKKHQRITAVGLYGKVFKSFWHWYQRTQKKEGREIRDITTDLDNRDPKPKFVYFTIEDLQNLCDKARYDYKVMMMFMFDAGVRSPTELMNVKVSDLEWSDKQIGYTLTIREETSKTFGRRIKLLLCSQILKEYIIRTDLKPDQYLFNKTPQRMNQYLKNLAYKVLKIGTIEKMEYNGRKYTTVRNGISMYDFRHASACYWLPRYKSESALKYRFGWKKSEMIHYYTELLGMRDTIQEEDLYIDVSKTELERQITEKAREIEIMQERLQDQDSKMKEILDIIKAIQLDKQAEQKIAIQTPT